MRTVSFAGWPAPVSALGFGCASLGSRVSRKDGVAAIDRALAAGVTWFDVAPSYGDGEAEAILGSALAGTEVAIVTKVGLRATPIGMGMRIARAVARPLVARHSGLQRLARRIRGSAALPAPLTGEAVRTSLMRSLERLKIDRVAVLAVHDPAPEDVRKQDLIRALNDAKREGLAVRIAIAGSLESFITAKAAGLAVDVLQIGNSPFDGHSEQVRRTALAGDFVVTHSAFGSGAALVRLRKLVREDAELRRGLERIGRGYATDLPRLLLDYAVAANPNGVVLFSSFAPRHFASNEAAVGREPVAGLVAEVDGLLHATHHIFLTRPAKEVSA